GGRAGGGSRGGSTPRLEGERLGVGAGIRTVPTTSSMTSRPGRPPGRWCQPEWVRPSHVPQYGKSLHASQGRTLGSLLTASSGTRHHAPVPLLLGLTIPPSVLAWADEVIEWPDVNQKAQMAAARELTYSPAAGSGRKRLE